MSAWVMFKSSVPPDSTAFKLFKEAGYCGIITKRHSGEEKKLVSLQTDFTIKSILNHLLRMLKFYDLMEILSFK